MTRDEAWNLLNEYTQSESLIKHALAAEVLVNGNKSAVVRERQKLSRIWGGEKLPGWLK